MNIFFQVFSYKCNLMSINTILYLFSELFFLFNLMVTQCVKIWFP